MAVTQLILLNARKDIIEAQKVVADKQKAFNDLQLQQQEEVLDAQIIAATPVQQ